MPSVSQIKKVDENMSSVSQHKHDIEECLLSDCVCKIVCALTMNKFCI